ncbi:MAG: hypothetical protein MUE50_14055, partial [Pirellulaceae bacterium]|nr:hypothetical protein [Pirellulaceae bacterium]
MFRRYLQALNVNPKHRQSRRTSRRLCLEPLEPRQLLSVVPAVGSLPNWPPVISSPVAVLDAASGRTAALSVSASDDRPESQLTYTWKVASKPNGAPTPTFAANRSNAAKATEVTFGRPGSYLLSATAIDAGKLGATSLVAIDVPQVLTNISVSPASVSLYTGDPQTFHAHGYDQFGRRLATPPAWTWTASAGQIDTIGRFRAPDTAATVTIDVSSGSMHGTAQAEVRVNTPPTVATPASAVLDSADGKTATLTVLGDDDAGEAKLKYTWTATVTPTGAPKPTFSVNRTNAAKNSTVTFGRAGTYQLTATIADAKGLTVTSPVTIVVTAALTQIAVEPASATVYAATTQTFAAHALDQFGQALSPAPVLTWTTGAGQIDAAGRFTAPGSTGAVTISAASGAVRGQTQVQVTPAFQDIRDGQLQPLLRSLFVDRAIDRADMVRVLRSVGDDDGQVDATELSDLKTLLDRAPSLAMPNHVRVLADNVVRGNPANALYQGQTLGNLLVGSTDGQLDKLVDKWFLGADRPVAAGVYRSIAGPLFVAGPSYTD